MAILFILWILGSLMVGWITRNFITNRASMGDCECPTNTKCNLRTGGQGCCPIYNGVCCSDGEHCCPPGYKCSIEHEECIPDDSEMNKTPAIAMETLYQCQ